MNNTEMFLKWEASSNGLNAVRLERKPSQTSNPVGVAKQKAWDIEWIRAAFGGEWTSFGPYFRLWITDGKDAKGVTILMYKYPRDEPSVLPDVCIRWTEWHGHIASQEFTVANDKHQYLLDGLPLQCTLRFYRADEIGIDQLMERTSTLMSRGAPFTRSNRPELYNRSIEIEFCDGMLSYHFDFSPGAFANVSLEQVVHEWLDYARSLDTLPDVPPDEGFQIAYRESLWERIARL